MKSISHGYTATFILSAQQIVLVPDSHIQRGGGGGGVWYSCIHSTVMAFCTQLYQTPPPPLGWESGTETTQQLAIDGNVQDTSEVVGA